MSLAISRAIGLFVALILALPGWSSERRLVVWGESLGPEAKGLQAAVDQFERQNPGLKVSLLGMGAGGMNAQKLMTSIVGKVPPDLVIQDRFTISDWACRGAFRPLNDLLGRDKKDPLCPKQADYYKASWQEATFNGAVYAIPTTADNRILYYNKKLFQQKGLDPNRAPRTWTELLVYSRALTDLRPDKTIEIAGFLPNFGNSWLYLYAFQNGGSFLSSDGLTCTMATPETAAALQFMLDGYSIVGGYDNAMRFVVSKDNGLQDPFLHGKLAMKIDGDGFLAQLAASNSNVEIGCAAPPAPESRASNGVITWGGGYSMAIPIGARNVEDAWKYIKFMSSWQALRLSMDAQMAFEQGRGRMFVPKIRANREHNRKIVELSYLPDDERIRAAFETHIDLMERTKTRPVTVVATRLWAEHVRAMEFALLGVKSPIQALQDAQKVVQMELDSELGRERFPMANMGLAVALGALGLIVAMLIGFRRCSRAPLGLMTRHEARWGYLLIAPWLIGFLLFTAGPMIASLIFSFTSYDALRDARWVGLLNYQDLLRDDQHLLAKAFMNVLYLGGVGVPLGLITGLSIALLLNGTMRGAKFFRTAFFLPSITPSIATVVLWAWMLSPDPAHGIVNFLWSRTITNWFGFLPPGWLGAESWAKPALILMGLWGAGGGVFLWLAGLKNISSSLYESATIDGASPMQLFVQISLPQLTPLIFFNTAAGLIGALHTFESSYAATMGLSAGPNDALLTPVYHLVINGFTYFKIGYASALAWVIFSILLILTLIQFKFAPLWVHYEVEQ